MPEIDEFREVVVDDAWKEFKNKRSCGNPSIQEETHFKFILKTALRNTHNKAVEECIKIVDDGDAHCGQYDCCRSEHERNLVKSLHRLRKE